jgi:putative alpha-1,2-mannosidase
MIQPRDRTGDNGNWDSDAPFWDDHYTLWDTWKTLFPLMAIIRPDVVRDNVNSFIDRHKHNGYVATAFIQGKEYKVGQGGDEVDNVIADVYAKSIPGVNWQDAYELLRYHADQNRTANYRDHGYVCLNEKTDFCQRMKSGSGTLAFAYNDFCAAQLSAISQAVAELGECLGPGRRGQRLHGLRTRSQGRRPICSHSAAQGL